MDSAQGYEVEGETEHDRWPISASGQSAALAFNVL
jgi:hypothetical protein